MDLKPGELVRVKSYEQILETLDLSASNRGLSFDAELVPYCGKVFRVRTRIERFIDEKTGKMLKMKTPAVILDGAYCQSLYSGKRILCPRAVFLWWREIWLERVSESGIVQSGPDKGVGHTKCPEDDRGRRPLVDIPQSCAMPEWFETGLSRRQPGAEPQLPHSDHCTVSFRAWNASAKPSGARHSMPRKRARPIKVSSSNQSFSRCEPKCCVEKLCLAFH